MKILTICLALFAGSVFAQEVSLERMEKISVIELDGYLSVRCDQGWRSYSCYTNYLKGGDYGRVVVTNGTIDADYVKLQREGSKHIKGAKFDSKTGKTKKNFNLWIRTLFQRALLKFGPNTIKYTFTKNKKVVKEGTFEVEVIQGEQRTCHRDTLYYNQCPTGSSACDDYFYRNNFCR